MPLAGKSRGSEFHDFLQQAGIKAWSFKAAGLAGIDPGGPCTARGEKAGKQPKGRQHGNSNVRNG